MYATINKFSCKQRTRLIANETIMNFQTLLKNKNWKSDYIDKDPNHMFYSFLCIFLNIFQANFSVKYKSMKDKNDWITQEIKISCKHKRSLYTFTKNSNDPKVKAHYIKYCTVPRKVIKEAQKQCCSRLRAKSNNTIKAT